VHRPLRVRPAGDGRQDRSEAECLVVEVEWRRGCALPAACPSLQSSQDNAIVGADAGGGETGPRRRRRRRRVGGGETEEEEGWRLERRRHMREKKRGDCEEEGGWRLGGWEEERLRRRKGGG
jgi:hypothetical protein